jgi:hypothetical protein
MRRFLPLVSLLLLVPPAIAACGGIVIEPTTKDAPPPSSTSPTPTATSSASASPTPTPTPAPAPTLQPSPETWDGGAACWSPGPRDPGSSLTDGPCSLVGLWVYTTELDTIGSLAFDSYGNWVGGGPSTFFCSGSAYHGTYTLDGSSFTFPTIDDSSICNPDWEMTYTVTFNAACTTASFTEVIDNCTGGRTEFGTSMTLTKE